MSRAQTVTRQRAEHEKWWDGIYPAYYTLARVVSFSFGGDRCSHSENKITASAMTGETGEGQQIQMETLSHRYIST